ncbi:SUMO-specific isopeptidase USPL1 isoform X2 [Lampris incognitus]|uniref:SUMO-specific isopeptidase USPL1 isoform X2 n=1 Tax=Lampris incognitus TaxID=2546036 RepID=UPI0024B52AB9|nr:SUMO-specific isopeptidase USPL1 isoform X2 [Lampris incognitus]
MNLVLVEERGSSLESCPWCASKGLTSTLQSYRITLHESIILCTNRLCLFPLVDRPLEHVLASLVPVAPDRSGKRNNTLEEENKELVAPSPKRMRTNGDNSPVLQGVADTLNSRVELTDFEIAGSSQPTVPKTETEETNVYNNPDYPIIELTEQELLQSRPVEAVAVLAKAAETAISTHSVTSSKAVSPIKKDERGDSLVRTYSDTRPATVEPTLHTARHLSCSSKDTLSTNGDIPLVSSPHNALGTPTVTDREVSDIKNGHAESPPEVLCSPHDPDPSQCRLLNEVINSAQISTLSQQPGETEQTTINSQMISSFIEEVRIKSEPGDVSPTGMSHNLEKWQDDVPSKPVMTTTMSDQPEDFVSVPSQLFWRNNNNLCWLDTLLVAVVNCQSLRSSKPKDEPQHSSVWQLIRKYDEVCGTVKAHQQTCTDGVVRVSNQVLQKAYSDLENLRMSIFKLMQPKLRCHLGQQETPVFAMPLLLVSDSWAEPLFQLTYRWEFECGNCKSTTNVKVEKTLPSFTNILPDWHPLHATHRAPCNSCKKKNQTRTMVLERVPAVLVLHFMEGLPDNDVRIYSFNFQGRRYSVTTVIQFDQQLKHFVTWIRKSNGSWLEFDDLKHPACATHTKLPVPAQDMHIVFWEMETNEQRHVCSPTTTVPDPPPPENELNCQFSKKLGTDEPLVLSPDQSPLISHSDTDIVSTLAVSDEVVDTTVTAGVNTSIGCNTLLEMFEGLTHNDTVTLTLVEVKVGSEGRPLADSKQTLDLSPTNNESSIVPDTSSTVITSKTPYDDALGDPSLSVSEIVDGSPSNPTFAPIPRRGRTQRKEEKQTTQKGKKALEKAAPVSSENVTVKQSKTKFPALVSGTIQAYNAPPVEIAQQASSVSSTKPSQPPVSPKSPKPQPSIDPSIHCTLLLDRGPPPQVHSSVAKLSPTPNTVSYVKPIIPTHSTPNLVKRKPPSVGQFPKTQLRREDCEALPLKTAEMYGAFSSASKRTSTPPCASSLSQLPLKALCTSKSKVSKPDAAMSHSQVKTSLPPFGAKEVPKIPPSNKHNSVSSKVPPSLSDTEALRHKLLKKLKMKKKKLNKLNKLLSHQKARPDSTELNSPNYDTSSIYGSSTYDELFTDFLSPATTTSNLSPDSTSLLEMLTNGQESCENWGYGGRTDGVTSQVNVDGSLKTEDNFLEDFISGVAAQQQTETEREALSGLDLFF